MKRLTPAPKWGQTPGEREEYSTDDADGEAMRNEKAEELIASAKYHIDCADQGWQVEGNISDAIKDLQKAQSEFRKTSKDASEKGSK